MLNNRFVIVFLLIISFTVPNFFIYAQNYARLLQEAQDRLQILITARYKADENAKNFTGFVDKRPYILEAEKINKEIKELMIKIREHKEALARAQEAEVMGQSIVNLGRSRGPLKEEISELEKQIDRNKEIMRGFKERPTDPTLRNVYDTLNEEISQLQRSLRKAKEKLQDMNKEIGVKLSRERVAEQTAQKTKEAGLSQLDKLNKELKDFQSALKEARRSLRPNQEQIKGLEQAIEKIQGEQVKILRATSALSQASKIEEQMIRANRAVEQMEDQLRQQGIMGSKSTSARRVMIGRLKRFAGISHEALRAEEAKSIRKPLGGLFGIHPYVVLRNVGPQVTKGFEFYKKAEELRQAFLEGDMVRYRQLDSEITYLLYNQEDPPTDGMIDIYIDRILPVLMAKQHIEEQQSEMIIQEDVERRKQALDEAKKIREEQTRSIFDFYRRSQEFEE